MDYNSNKKLESTLYETLEHKEWFVKMAEYESKQDHTAAEEDRVSQEKLPVITLSWDLMLGSPGSVL